MKKLFFISVLSILALQTAGAWGAFGHRTIVEIAKRHLTDEAKAKIEAVMGTDIALEASYMDKHRKDDNLKYAYSYHNFGVDPKTNEFNADNGFDTGGGLLAGLTLTEFYFKHFETLSEEHKKTVIRLAIHFIGDMHCPAHAFFQEHVQRWKLDLGDGTKPEGFHGFYDHFPEKRIFAGKTELEAAEMLDNFKKCQIRKVTKGTPEDWVKDCIKTDLEVLEVNPIPADPMSTIKANPKTLEYSVQVVERQMATAGYRLAAFLNKYLSK